MNALALGRHATLAVTHDWTEVERILRCSQLPEEERSRPMSEAEARQISTWHQMGPENLAQLAEHGICSEEEYIQHLTGKTPQELTASAVISLVHIRQKAAGL